MVAMSTNLLVLVGALVVSILIKPADQAGEGLSGIVGILSEVELGNISALVVEGNVNKVPVTLVVSPFALDVICECCAFHKRVVLLLSREGSVRLLQV